MSPTIHHKYKYFFLLFKELKTDARGQTATVLFCRLTIEFSIAWKAAIITLILHMPWDPDDLIGIFIFWKHLFSMKPLCFEKNNMKTSFTHDVGKPASLGTLPWRKQSGENRFLSVNRLCILGECWYTTDSNNAPRIDIDVNSRLPLLSSFPFFLCEKMLL